MSSQCANSITAQITQNKHRPPLHDGSSQTTTPNKHEHKKALSSIIKQIKTKRHVVEHDQIDKINILNATLTAMGAALGALPARPDVALVDGNRPPKPEMLPQGGKGLVVETIVKGDASVYCIAAASIIAKVLFLFVFRRGGGGFSFSPSARRASCCQSGRLCITTKAKKQRCWRHWGSRRHQQQILASRKTDNRSKNKTTRTHNTQHTPQTR